MPQEERTANDELIQLLRSVATRFITRAESGPWGEATSEHLDWDAGEIVAHIATVCEYFREIVVGGGSSVPSLAALKDTNSAGVIRNSGRPWGELMEQIWAEVDEVCTALEHHDPDESSREDNRQQLFKWHGGAELGTREVLGVVVGEFLIHERDLLLALGEGWELPKPECRTVIPALQQVLPLVLNPRAAQRVACRWRLRIAGVETFDIWVAEGQMTVEAPRGRAQCHIRAQPDAFLLAAYGRTSVLSAGLRGKAVAYGRKPLKGLLLTKLLEIP